LWPGEPENHTDNDGFFSACQCRWVSVALFLPGGTDALRLRLPLSAKVLDATGGGFLDRSVSGQWLISPGFGKGFCLDSTGELC
jgi:hypothetical protein